jgi:uncharacterized cupredoxin-like copper-binding protein
MRRIATLMTVSLLALTACGGGGDAAADTTPPPTEAAVDTEAPAATEPPAGTTAPVETEASVETELPADTTVTNPAAPSGAVSVGLLEWAIETDPAVAAGTVTFDVSNGGDFPHHFAIARGNSYDELPQVGGGAIDEDTLGDDFIGRTANLQSGETATIEFDLDPGNYVFFCNIAGTVSHAAQGQVLSVTVA